MFSSFSTLVFTAVHLFYRPPCGTRPPKMLRQANENGSVQTCTPALGRSLSLSGPLCPVLEVTSPQRSPVSSLLLTLGASPLPDLSKTDTVPQWTPGPVPAPLGRLTVSLISPPSLVVSRHRHENRGKKGFFQALQSKKTAFHVWLL